MCSVFQPYIHIYWGWLCEMTHILVWVTCTRRYVYYIYMHVITWPTSWYITYIIYILYNLYNLYHLYSLYNLYNLLYSQYIVYIWFTSKPCIKLLFAWRPTCTAAEGSPWCRSIAASVARHGPSILSRWAPHPQVPLARRLPWSEISGLATGRLKPGHCNGLYTSWNKQQQTLASPKKWWKYVTEFKE